MKKFKMMMVFLVALMVIMATSTVAFATNDEVTFSDVPEDAWYYEYVMEMNESGIVCGNPDGTFSPNKPVSIGEYCTMICRALDANVDKYDGYVEYENHWAAKYVRYIKSSGGWQNRIRISNPDENMTRKEAVEVGLRMFDYRFPVDAKYLGNPFTDTKNLTVPATNYLVNAYHLGIIDGNEKQEARGNDTITKAQACKIISNILKTDLSKPIKPDMLDKVTISFKCNGAESFYSDICYALAYYEDCVIESLSNNSKIIVTDEHYSNYVGNARSEVAGCYMPDKSIVCFTNGNYSSLFFGIGSTLKHEIGHYIYDVMLTNEEREIVNASFNSKEDVEFLKNITSSNYCETNVYEYFAEFISAYNKKSHTAQTWEVLNSMPISEVLTNYVK